MQISPVGGGGAVTYSDTGCYQGGTSFVKEKHVGTPQYDIAHIPSPGVDGTGSINYGFRTHKLSVIVVYLGASEEDIIGQQQTDSREMANGPSDIAMGSNTWYRCFLDQFEAKLNPKSTGLGDGVYYQECEISWTCRGLS